MSEPENEEKEKTLIPSSPSITPPKRDADGRLVPSSPSMSPPPMTPHTPPTPSVKKKEFSPHTPEGEKSERAPNSKDDFETMVEFYLASNPMRKTADYRTSELEVRFGTNTRSGKPISKIDYDNVVQQLYKSGFSTHNPQGLSILRIQNEYTDTREGETRISNVRAEIVGLDLIQAYCKSNSLQKLIDMPSSVSASAEKIKFTQKSPPMIKGKPLKPVEFPDFNFRIAYQMERDFTVRSDVAQKIVAKWTDSKKLFRYINRVRLSHPDIPVFADLSIIKGSAKTNRKVPLPQYTIQEAKVFQNQEHYEIELEVDNKRVGYGTRFDTAEKLLVAIRKCIRFVLSGLQGTNYPIAFSEKDQVLQTYMRMLHGEDYQPRRILSRDFIGPSSYTLQIENIQPEKEGNSLPTIVKNYTVTDKADGERRLLYIAPNGRIYMIDTNMNVIFTGTTTAEKTLHDSLLDGEYIALDKHKRPLGLYAAFDIYYIQGKSVREFAFIPQAGEDEETKFRLPLLNQFVSVLKPVSITDPKSQKKVDPKTPTSEDQEHHPCHFMIRCKDFYSSENGSIFQGCAKILSRTREDTMEYTTDGLIFTPSNTGVASHKAGSAGPLHKTTWDGSFKWKPPEFNTIDFLVSVKKDKTGKDEIHHVFQEGTAMSGTQNVLQYKTLVLRCGFNERDHGYLNPMLDVIQDNLPSPSDLDNDAAYKPVAFQPTNPYDPQASICNVYLHNNGINDLVMMSEEHEYFEEDTIVEFRYDTTRDTGWKWIPLRVRYDKTNELRAGLKNYGNAYHVANGNWHSIHNPVTEEMVSTGKNIPEAAGDEDVYYNKSGSKTNTRPLRDFHNLFVKRKLILGTAHRGQTLIDYAVGKAGDMPKWIAAKLEFVFGIDVSKDNIENHLDGACARFLNYKKKYHTMPGALFVNGNSGLNIRSGSAPISEIDKQITQAVFGQGPKDKDVLGKGVFKRYGIGESGFHVSSCQFALHYFFESEKSMHSFLRNVAECTRVGGYFIGTCYDGETVFNLLKHKTKEDGIAIMREDTKIYEIIKQYDQTGFPPDELSLGYAIDIYQESINKVFREFLVNFRYLTRIMEDYGFSLVPQEEARKMGLPNATGLFEELFDSMVQEVAKDKRKEVDYGTALSLTREEKRISFMNRYFMFKKMRNVNAEKIAKIVMHRQEEDEDAEDDSHDGQSSKEETSKVKVPVFRKIKGKKIVLTEGSKPSASAPDPTNNSLANVGITLGKTVSIRVKKPVQKPEDKK
jgi:hypothetical protein